nr:reverse transcriptase domain-containing protein [Tanacetum cinerariifolium]
MSSASSAVTYTSVYTDSELEDGPVDYPMDGGDDGDDDDGDSSRDNADDKDEEEEDEEEEEEEHLAPADFAVVIPTDELAAISLPPEAEVERLLAIPTPSPSPLTLLSPPSAWERLARCTTPTALPSPPLPPPLHMPPPIDHMDDVPETEMPPRKRLCLSTIGSRYEVGESSAVRPTGGQGIDYGFVSTLDAEIDPAETVPDIAPMTVGDVNTWVTELAELYEHDIQDLYALLEDAQDSRTHISQRIVEDEAYATREAWTHSIGLSQAVHSELQTHQEQGEIKKLEIELWNLKVKENNVSTYTERFQELNLICTKFVADETEKIDKYVSRLPDNIYGSMKASKPKTLDETIELAKDLMDQKLHTYAERSFGNVNVTNAQRNNGENPKGNGCFECGATRHIKRDCPKLKNKDGEKGNTPGWVYAVGNAEK